MKSKNEILSILNDEYNEKKIKNTIKTQENKDKFYKLHPFLKSIEDDIGQTYLKIMKNQILKNHSNENLYKKIDYLKSEKAKYIRENNVDLSLLDEIFSCKLCKDKGEVIKNGKIEKCQCFISRYNFLMYENTNLLELTKKCNFQKFNLNIFDNNTKISNNLTQRDFMKLMKNMALTFINNFENPNEKSLIFYGETGLGKSFLCLCIARELINKSKTVMYVSSPSLFKNLEKATFSPIDKKLKFEDFQNLIYNCDLLIIDDLGTEVISSFTIKEFLNIVNERILNNKKIIISTNLSPNDIKNAYDIKLLSRFNEYFIFYKFIGNDLRFFKNK